MATITQIITALRMELDGFLAAIGSTFTISNTPADIMTDLEDNYILTTNINGTDYYFGYYIISTGNNYVSGYLFNSLENANNYNSYKVYPTNSSNVIFRETNLDEKDYTRADDQNLGLNVGNVITFVNTPAPAQGSSSGDPHVYPMFGKMYELPNKVANYRMLQGNDLIINAATRQVTPQEGEQIKTYYRNVVGEEAPANLLTDGVFYKAVYVEAEGNKMFFSFETLKGNTNGNGYFNVETKQTNTKGLNKYEQSAVLNQVIVTFNHTQHGECQVCFNHFSNPQIKYGLSANVENSQGLAGLLVREYLCDSVEVAKLGNTEEVIGVQRKNKVLSYFNK